MTQDQQAIDYLIKVEPRFKPVVDRFGCYELKSDDKSNLFQAVSRTIIFQQLAGKAANSIHEKFKTLFIDNFPTADQTVTMSIEHLRSAGLSNAKAKAVHHLASCVLDKTLPKTQVFKTLSDHEVIDHLVKVKGVGPWTANIALMFWLARPDVFPVNDLGLKKGAQLLLELADLPSEEQLGSLAKSWQPYRTYASWYLWRALEL